MKGGKSLETLNYTDFSRNIELIWEAKTMEGVWTHTVGIK